MADGAFRAELAADQTRTSAGVGEVINDAFDGMAEGIRRRRRDEMKSKGIVKGSIVYYTKDPQQKKYRVYSVWEKMGTFDLIADGWVGKSKSDVEPYDVTVAS